MSQDQLIILIILLATAAMFMWGRWRHDVVALASLLACVFTGLVPADDAFSGFAHPAVITVACVQAYLSTALWRGFPFSPLASSDIAGRGFTFFS